MTPNQFRQLALGLPEVSEGAHMNHADFRVGGKVFATIGPDEDWGMVKLTSEDQARLCEKEPNVFEPFNGAWGRHGATKIWLAPSKKATAQQALLEAWRNIAPKKLVMEYDSDETQG